MSANTHAGLFEALKAQLEVLLANCTLLRLHVRGCSCARMQEELEREMRLYEQLHGSPPLEQRHATPPLPGNDTVSPAARHGAMEARPCVAGDWKKGEEAMTPSQLLGFAIAEV